MNFSINSPILPNLNNLFIDVFIFVTYLVATDVEGLEGAGGPHRPRDLNEALALIGGFLIVEFTDFRRIFLRLPTTFSVTFRTGTDAELWSATETSSALDANYVQCFDSNTDQ